MDGKAHTFATVLATIPVGVAAAYVTHDPGLALLCSAGCLAGTVVGSDLDHEWVTANERVFWRLSPAFGIPYSLVWLPYSLLPHRSFASHFPVVGTLGRLLYLAALLWIVQLHLRAVGVPVDVFAFLAYPRLLERECDDLPGARQAQSVGW